MIHIRSKKKRMEELAKSIIRGLTSEDEDVGIDTDDLMFILENAYENVIGERLTTSDEAGYNHTQGNSSNNTKEKRRDQKNNKKKRQTTSNKKTTKDESQNDILEEVHVNSDDEEQQKEREKELAGIQKAVKAKKKEQQSKNYNQGFFEDIPEPEDIGNSSNHPDFGNDKDNEVINEPL